MTYRIGTGKTGRINKPRARNNPPRHFSPWERVEYYGWTEVAHAPELGLCWESKAPQRNDKYHSVGYGTGVYLAAHRVSYEHHRGPIPEGLLIRHRCDNTHCINPEHLLPGTHADNMEDKMSRGRQAKGPNAILDSMRVAEIKAKLREGVPTKALGREYGVHRNTIRSIARGLTWKWVD